MVLKDMRLDIPPRSAPSSVTPVSYDHENRIVIHTLNNRVSARWHLSVHALGSA
jgi:hypothetical protein